jgi:hypothetical protein
MKRSHISLAALTLGAIAVGISACSGSGDDVASPTPVPFNPTYCYIDWQLQQDADHYHNFRVFMSAGRWGAGANNYSDGQNVAGFLAYSIPNTATNLSQAALLGLATNGDFTTTATGVEAGNNVTFNDSTTQSFTIVGTDFTTKLGHLGSGGNGDFTGTWSDPTHTNPLTLGTGTVHFVFTDGSNLTLGSVGSNGGTFGICIDPQVAQHQKDWMFRATRRIGTK